MERPVSYTAEQLPEQTPGPRPHRCNDRVEDFIQVRHAQHPALSAQHCVSALRRQRTRYLLQTAK